MTTTSDGIYQTILDDLATLNWRIYGIDERGFHWHIGIYRGTFRGANLEGWHLIAERRLVSFFLEGK